MFSERLQRRAPPMLGAQTGSGRVEGALQEGRRRSLLDLPLIMTLCALSNKRFPGEIPFCKPLFKKNNMKSSIKLHRALCICHHLHSDKKKVSLISLSKYIYIYLCS